MMIDGEDKKGHELVFGMRVYARVRGGVEEAHFLDVGAAFTQNEVWRAAGYTDIALTPAYFVCDDDGEWRPVSIGNPVLIANRPVPARYTRADTNPGIGLRRYEREVLKRPRATTGEIICAVMITILLVIALVYLLLQPIVLVTKALQLEGWMTCVLITAIACSLLPASDRWMKAATRIAEKIVGIPSVKEWYAN